MGIFFLNAIFLSIRNKKVMTVERREQKTVLMTLMLENGVVVVEQDRTRYRRSLEPLCFLECNIGKFVNSLGMPSILGKTIAHCPLKGVIAP